MNGVDIKARFAESIRARGVDDRYIDRDEEREIVQIALQLGMTRDTASAELARVCADLDYVLETDAVRVVRERLLGEFGPDGRVDRAGFTRLVEAARESVRGRVAERELRRLVVTVIEDEPTARVKTGWLWNWYKSMRKELGLF